MKVIVVLAIIAAASASFCDNAMYKAGIGAAKAQALIGERTVIGHCTSFSLNSLVFDSDAPCNILFEEGYCYGKYAKDYYGSGSVSYGKVADDVDNIAKLGNLACEHGRACFEAVRDALVECNKKAGFLDELYINLEAAYLLHGKKVVEDLASKETILGELAEFGTSRIHSMQQVKEFIETHVTEGVMADAASASQAVQKAAAEFCDSGCVDQTASFAKRLFIAMDDDTCPAVDPLNFCGDCQELAGSVMDAIPCCLKKVIEDAAEGVTMFEEKYEEQIQAVKDAAEEILSDSSKKQIAEIQKQLQCVQATYGLSDSCEYEA